MTIKNLLRIFIVINIIITIVYVIIGINSKDMISQNLLNNLETQAISNRLFSFQPPEIIVTIILITCLLSKVALLLIWKPARHIYLVTSLLLIIFDFITNEPFVIFGIDHSIHDLGLITDGIIIGLLYFSSASNLFSREIKTINDATIK